MTGASEKARSSPERKAAQPNPPGERAEPAPEPRPEESELRCTICGLKACWTR